MSRLNRSYSEQRVRCLLTTTIAFCLGVSVGALLPFFFPPVDILPSPLSLKGAVANPHVESVLSRGPNLFTPTPEVNPTNSYPRAPIPYEYDNAREISVSSTPSSSVTIVNNSLESETEESWRGDNDGVTPLVEGVYWSDWVERMLPKGFSDEDVTLWRVLASNSSVSKVESGCGRMQNRLVTYGNGKKACCRYRQNFDQIQGDIFSFYLSQLLSIHNLAPSTLDVIDSKSVKWQSVQNELEDVKWVDERPVVLTEYVNNLSPAYIPSLFRASTRRVHPPDLPPLPPSSQLGNSSEKQALEEISELAQWSDLIVFDYLTANLDRMVNNLYNLQWNPAMMEAPAHNLAKETSTGLLVFLDNESGLLHGYRLLDKYEHYHRLMLDSLCVFRKSTAEAIKRLHKYGNIQPLFKSMLSQFSKSTSLPMIPDKSIKVLNQRIGTVYRQIQKCQSLYSNNSNNNNNIKNDQINSKYPSRIGIQSRNAI